MYSIPNISKSASTMRILNMNHNLIEQVNASTFEGFTKLIRLHLEFNKISIFHGVLDIPSLKYIYMAENELTLAPNISLLPNLFQLDLEGNLVAVHNNSFKDANPAQIVIMTNNKLIFPPGIDGIKPTIRELKLSSNKITSIPIDYFQNCPNLKEVWLYNNRITAISWGQSIGPAMEKLRLSINFITGVPANTFVNATGLTELLLWKNKLTEFHMGNLNYMPHLKTLDLQENHLTELQDPYPHCPGYKCGNLTISASGNSIPCDYKLCWAKAATKIGVLLSSCLGKQWTDIIANDLNCHCKYFYHMD